MVEAVNPDKLLVNEPIPEPSVVLVLNEIVGDEVDELQQMPRAVTAEPPSIKIVPPLTAVV